MQLALYLRDVLALSVDAEPYLPAIEPAVPVDVPSHVDRAKVQRQWPAWWEAVLTFAGNRRADGPAMPEAILEDSAISVAVQHFRADFERHHTELFGADRGRTAGGRVAECVREFERERGRATRPFRLVITEVSVAGRIWHRLGGGHVLVSSRFAEDQAALGEALRELVAEVG